MSLVFHHSRRQSRAISPLEVLPPPPGTPWWRRLLAPPDPLHVDAGVSGEVLVAKIRLLLTGCLVMIPLLHLLGPNEAWETVIGLSVGLTALVSGIVFYAFVRRGNAQPWLGFASSIYDVTFVSCALLAFLLIGRPHTAVNSKIIYEAYFLAIGATSLRYDLRICLVAGGLAVLQYGAIVTYAALRWDLNDPSFAPFPYGMFDWGAQAGRMILLASAAILSAAIVSRTQSLRRLSRSDRLTGLPNRSYFDERAVAELSRSRRSGTPLALAMIDVDHFKRFNDGFGHAAGDLALRAVAQCIQGAVRESDLVVRYGGEEFVALFPGMTPKAAVERVEMIRQAVSAMPIHLPRTGQEVFLTLSAGVAVSGVDGNEVEALLDVADSRLFEAKETGRNRVIGPGAELAAVRDSAAALRRSRA